MCLSATISCVRETQLKRDQLQMLLDCPHSGHSKYSNPRISPRLLPVATEPTKRSVFRNLTTHGASSPSDDAFHSRSFRAHLQTLVAIGLLSVRCM
jgi:hypothetical protein